jgi:phospholipase C
VRCEAPAAPLADEQGRCGFGPRLPLLVISPWAKTNYVDPLDQHEGVKFDLGGMFDFGAPPNTTPYILDPVTGNP